MENRTRLFIFILLFAIIPLTCADGNFDTNYRLIILADISNESDQEQQIVYMIVCSNEFELEDLIAVTGKYLRSESRNPYKQVTHHELFINIINGYETNDSVYRHLQRSILLFCSLFVS